METNLNKLQNVCQNTALVAQKVSQKRNVLFQIFSKVYIILGKQYYVTESHDFTGIFRNPTNYGHLYQKFLLRRGFRVTTIHKETGKGISKHSCYYLNST